jgi:hypothetical protein
MKHEISVKTYRGQNGIVVLPHLVSGYSRCAFRCVARAVAQLIGDKRNCWCRFTVERSNSTLRTVKPLADVSTVSHALLCFELFRSHKRSGVYLGAAIAAGRVVLVLFVMRHLCVNCSRLEENSTGCSGLATGWSDRT